MGLVAPLLGFGIGLMAFGFYWKLFEDIINAYFQPFIIVSDSYYLCDLIWHILPWLTMFIAVLCLISAGLLGRSQQVVVSE